MQPQFRTTRRAFLGALLATPFVLRYTPAYAGASAATKRFTIVHSNDPHGHLLPFSYADKMAPGDFVSYMPEHRHIGGVARRATMVQRIKSKEKNVHVFDLGDSMDGSPFSVEFLGVADYEANNTIGYDWGTYGNHDFNMSKAQFDNMRSVVKYPMLLANVYDKTTGASIEKPYVIENWDGLKVAILGLTTYESRTYKAIVEGFTMKDPFEVASDLVPKLRKQADLVILLSHMGYDKDKIMARDIPGIDIIVGAHSHTRLPVGDYETAGNPKAGDPQGTVIVQAHCWGGELGRLDFMAQPGEDGKWRVAQYTAGLIMMDDKVPDHPKTKAVVDKYWSQIATKYNEAIGEAKDEFVNITGSDATNYYLVCDGVLAGFPDAEFELENFGGVRAPILRGKITRSEMIEVDPFANTIFTFGIKGSDLKKLLGYTRPAPSKTLRYSAKGTLRADGSGKKDWTFVDGTLNGAPIADDKVYKGVTSSYYFAKEVQKYAINPVDTGKLRLDYVIAYIQKNTPISPIADGRLTLLGGTQDEL